MKNGLCFWLFLAGGLGADSVFADAIAGIDKHVANADVILLVEKTDDRRLWVKKVLKGVVFDQWLPANDQKVKAGDRGLLLFRHADEPSLSMPEREPPETSFWVLNKDNSLNTRGVPKETGSGFGPLDFDGITLDFVRQAIEMRTPEQIGLCNQVILACVLPRQLEKLRADRRRYVRFYTIIGDFDRDVGELAKLLMAKDPRMISAAQTKLLALTNRKVSLLRSAPSIAERERASRDWQRWWSKHRHTLVGNAKGENWMQDPQSTEFRQWPPVPNGGKIPAGADNFPKKLMLAVEAADAGRFSLEFRSWLDSGVMRDRSLIPTSTMNSKLFVKSGVVNAQWTRGGHLPPAPRLPAEIVHGDSEPVGERVAVMALLAADWNFERFRRERLRATQLIVKRRVGPESIRRAAFWEPESSFTDWPGFAAREVLDLERRRTKGPKPPKPVDVESTIKAIEKLADSAERTELICKLSPIADKRALTLFLKVGPKTRDSRAMMAIAHGLAKIGDKQALPVLVKMADESKRCDPDYVRKKLLRGIVNAFGHVSGLFKTPALVRDGHELNYGNYLKLEPGLSKMREWQKRKGL